MRKCLWSLSAIIVVLALHFMFIYYILYIIAYDIVNIFLVLTFCTNIL
nr:MAG TPA: hypothetical protein [Caudoviricetes sp.]